MNLSEKNRLRMLQSTLSFLKLSPAAVLLLLPLLSSLTTALELIVNAIIAAEQTQTTVATGQGSGKKAKKNALVNIADSVGRAILSFAGNTNNAELMDTMKTYLDRLDRQADTTILARCRAILDTCTQYDGELLPVGVTDDVRAILAASIISYENSGSTLRNKTADRKNAGKQIALLEKDATKLLKTQVDPLVRSLRDQESYVNTYNINRQIIDIGHRHTQFKGLTVAKDTHTHVSNVTIEFRNAEGSLFTVNSDVTGKYRELINPDVYDIIATHPEYETFTIEGVQIQAGEIKVENIELVPKA